MRIALDERFRSVAARHLPGHDLVFYASGTPTGRFATREEFLELVRDADALGCGAGGPWPFDEQVIAALPRLRFIHKIGAGTDWFDVEALNRHGVLLSTNAGLNAASVADHLVMLILMCLRSVVDPMFRLRGGEWPFVTPADIIEVEDATIGIIGFGRIGSAVATRLGGFGDVTVLACRRRPLDAAATPPFVRPAPFDELLRSSDAIVLCVPLTPETEGMLGARELARMKPGAVLVNGSRGRIVDERALADALASGHLKAAASDVFADEPPSPDHPLLRLPNFIGTPHMAGRSRRNSPRQLEWALENIRRFASGQRPERLINAEAARLTPHE